MTQRVCYKPLNQDDNLNIGELVTHSFENRKEIKASSQCSCFHCFARFSPNCIEYWCDSNDEEDEDPGGLRTDDEGFPGQTAVCPECEYDSVVGDACGVVLSDEVLKDMKNYWHHNKN